MNMRAHKKQFIEWTLLIVLWLSAIPGWSQEEVPFAEENTYITVSGVVKDKQNRKTLEYVNVSVPGRSVGTVTNADGEFSLKIEDAEMVFIIRKSKFPQNPKRSVRFSGKRTKRSVQKRKARNTQKAETKVL